MNNKQEDTLGEAVDLISSVISGLKILSLHSLALKLEKARTKIEEAIKGKC